MKATEHISSEDLALYALGSLPEAETELARAHLAKCDECRRLLAEYTGDVGLIGLSLPQHPLPDGARQRFLSRVAEDAYSAKPAVEAKKAKVVAFPLRVVLPWAVAAGIAIFAFTLNGKIGVLNHQLQSESGRLASLKADSAQAKRVLDVLSSPSAQRVILTASKTAAQPTGRAIYVAETGSLLFQANNLKLIAEDKTYELWVIPVSGNPIPAGLFRPDATGSASVLLPSLPTGVEAKAFGVTIEKAEGSDTPTAPIVLSGATPAPSPASTPAGE